MSRILTAVTCTWLLAASAAMGYDARVTVGPGVQKEAIPADSKKVKVVAVPKAPYEILPSTVSVGTVVGNLGWRVLGTPTSQKAVYYGRAARFDAKVTGPWTVADLTGSLTRPTTGKGGGKPATPTYTIKAYEAMVKVLLRESRVTQHFWTRYPDKSFTLTADWEVFLNAYDPAGTGSLEPHLRLGGASFYGAPTGFNGGTNVGPLNGRLVGGTSRRRRWYVEAIANYHLTAHPAATAEDSPKLPVVR